MSELLDHNSILHFFHEGEIALRADHIFVQCIMNRSY